MQNTQDVGLMPIYWKISAKGLVSDLIEKVKIERESISRNTIILAFKNGGTTATRRMIIEKGEQLLAETETPALEGATT